MTTVAERNHNLGNLKLNRIVYNGQTGVDSRGFAIFANDAAGKRAADLNLQSYAKRGIHTPKQIIYGVGGAGGWSATDQQSYAAKIASDLGIGVNDTVDLTNPNVRAKVLGTIYGVETGTGRYSQGTLQDSGDDIASAVATGSPFAIALTASTALGDNVTNVVDGALEHINTAYGGIGSSIDSWLSDHLKDWGIPIVVGLGAIILVFASSWNLIKDTPVGSLASSAGNAAKSGAKVLAFL